MYNFVVHEEIEPVGRKMFLRFSFYNRLVVDFSFLMKGLSIYVDSVTMTKIFHMPKILSMLILISDEIFMLFVFQNTVGLPLTSESALVPWRRSAQVQRTN